MGQNIILSIITPVFSVTWSFRNHSNMLICCSYNIFYCYQCLKHFKTYCLCGNSDYIFNNNKKNCTQIWPYNIFFILFHCLVCGSSVQHRLISCFTVCHIAEVSFVLTLNSSRLKSWLTDSVCVFACSVKDVSNKEVLGVLVSYRVKVKLVVSRGGWVTCFLSTVSHTLGSSFDWSVTVHKY